MAPIGAARANLSRVPSFIPDSGDYQWHIDEGSGNTLNPDVGAVSATITGASWVSDSDAVGGQYLSHDGDDDEWVTDSGVLTTPFSAGGWVRFDNMTEFGNGIAGDDSTWYIDSDGDGAVLTVVGLSSRIRGQPFVDAGNWGFVAINAESNQHRLITFSNSQELADNTNSTGISNSGASLTVGSQKDGGFLTGDTDFWVVSEGSLLSKAEWTDLWQATQR